MAATTPSCHECIKGTIHPGLPLGKEEPLYNLPTYIVGNRTNPRGIIVIYSDVFGLSLPNNKLIADAYAQSGEWLVYLPDFFQGDPVALSVADHLIPVDESKQSVIGKYTGLLASAPGFLLWQRRHREGPTTEVCLRFLGALRRDQPDVKIGMVGFCWGGKYAVRAGLEGNMLDGGDGGSATGKKKPLVDAIVALHPSHLSLPDDVESLVVPVSFGWGVSDAFVKFEQMGLVKGIHKGVEKAGRRVPAMEHREYRPGRHGFAVRGNPDDPLERACLEDSVAQVLGWFGRWL
ncbi:Alpha/Beta hydrolase protein [Aspergillus varians]